jgi:hypothetical protein
MENMTTGQEPRAGRLAAVCGPFGMREPVKGMAIMNAKPLE